MRLVNLRYAYLISDRLYVFVYSSILIRVPVRRCAEQARLQVLSSPLLHPIDGLVVQYCTDET